MILLLILPELEVEDQKFRVIIYDANTEAVSLFLLFLVSFRYNEPSKKLSFTAVATSILCQSVFDGKRTDSQF
jgi:hypothetical protein